MKMIIHDLDQTEFEALHLKEDLDTYIIADNGTIKNCIGCFGCWVKTPGICVLKDNYQNMGKLMSESDELIIISNCVYGSYSPFVRNVLDRSIPYLLPYFAAVNGETHHRNRYDHKFKLTVHFYGNDISDSEKATAEALVAANSVNFYSTGNKVLFYPNLQTIMEVVQ